jgi:TonB family protein
MPDDAVKTTDATEGPAQAQAEPGGAPTPNADARATGEAAPDAQATLIGTLDAEERIRQSGEQGERTLWAGAVGASLLYTGLIASQVLLGAPLFQSEQERLRRGQDAQTISVELVPDPDQNARSRRWREGTEVQTQQPSENPPQPPQVASLPQPEIPETSDAQAQGEKGGAPALMDIDSLVDAAAADLTRKIDRAFREKPQKERRQQQAVISGGGMQVRGTGASGRSDAFTRSVIAALMKTRPGPFALWGRVLVSFQITESGALKYVHLLHSSGNSALDQAAVDAIRKARFERPPPGLSSDDRTYIIDYIFG